MFPYNQNMTVPGNIMPQNTYYSWKQHFHLLPHCLEDIWILTVCNVYHDMWDILSYVPMCWHI